MDVVNASVAVVDEDDSQPPGRYASDVAAAVPARRADTVQRNQSRPWTRACTLSSSTSRPSFSRTSTKGVTPTVEIITDATAMSQAGRGPATSRRSSTGS